MELKNAFNGLLSMDGTAEQELLYLNVGPQKLLRMKNQDKSLKHRKIRKNKSYGTVSTSAIIIPEVILNMCNYYPIWRRQNATK